MKILFSPSETKTTLKDASSITSCSFIFQKLFEKRSEVLRHYQHILDEKDPVVLSKLFGFKDSAKIKPYLDENIFSSFTCKAIERYSGIAYDHLDYASLTPYAKHFIENNVMIFSNLFGPLLAGDFIPEYKLQQGESLQGFKPENFYKTHFSNAIDDWIGNETLVDLRAGFYEKFYTPKVPTILMKFLKNGKVVSHFAKAYRGNVLRHLAQQMPRDEVEFQKICFEGLKIVEILHKNLKHEYVYEIID